MCQVELGQLEKRHADFANRHLRIIAVSNDNLEETKLSQEAFPHLQLVSDASHSMASTFDVLGPNHGPDGNLTFSPTTMLIDKAGVVRWIYRAERFIERLSPDDLLEASKTHLK